MGVYFNIQSSKDLSEINPRSSPIIRKRQDMEQQFKVTYDQFGHALESDSCSVISQGGLWQF